MITILGVDPGIRNMGWAVVERAAVGPHRYIDSGSFSTESNTKDKMEMLASFVIANEIVRIVTRHHPVRVYIEGAKPYGKQVMWSTIAGMSAAFTAVAFGAWSGGIPRAYIGCLYAQEWRLAINAKIGATKPEAYEKASRFVDRLPTGRTNEHQRDAICIAVAGANRVRV